MKKTNKNSIVKTIKTIRILKGFSQEYLAIKLSISQQAYQKIESGETKLTEERARKIAKSLDVDFNVLSVKPLERRMVPDSNIEADKQLSKYFFIKVKNQIDHIQSQQIKTQLAIARLTSLLSEKRKSK